MKSQNWLELVPFDDIYSELAPFVNLILDPNYKTNKIATLSPLDKQFLLQQAKDNFEDAFFILQEENLFKKFSQNDLIAIFHAHPLLIQEIVKTDEVNKYLEKKDLMEISHPDLPCARYLFLMMGDDRSSHFLEDIQKRTECGLVLAKTHEDIAELFLFEEKDNNYPTIPQIPKQLIPTTLPTGQVILVYSSIDPLQNLDYKNSTLRGGDLVTLAKNRPEIATKILSLPLLPLLTKEELTELNAIKAEEIDSSDVRDDKPIERVDNEKFNQFRQAFAQHLQKIETSAIVLKLLEKDKLLRKDINIICKLKHARAVVFDLNNEQLAKLDAMKYVRSILYIRKIRENALTLLEESLSQVEESQDLYPRMVLAALIPHVIDYCHRTSPEKECFVLSEEEVKLLIQRVLSSPEKVEKNTVAHNILSHAAALFHEKKISRKILPPTEAEDLVWYVKQLKEALNSPPLESSTPQDFLAKIKAIKTPQQKGLNRYFTIGDAENFKKIMGRGHLTELRHGPLVKNKYTRQLEYVVTTFMKSEDTKNIKIITKDDTTLIELDGVTFNLSEIVKYANFNHVELDDDDDSSIDLDERTIEAIDIKSISDTLSEMPKIGMDAINYYTFDCSDMNSLLRAGPQSFKFRLMEKLCRAFLASYSLNRASEENFNPVYRWVNPEEIEETEKHPETLVKYGGYSKEAFFSTSLSYLANTNYDRKANTHFIYCETKAPFIAVLAGDYESENEVLIPPSHFQWTHVKEDTDGNQYFIVKQVAALDALGPEEQKGLLEEGDSVPAPDPHGNTALHFAALFQPDLIEKLLEQGAHVNHANCHGVTPFHLIAKTGDETLIRLFLARGARLLVEDHHHIKPLDILNKRELSQALKDHIQRLMAVEMPSDSPAILHSYSSQKRMTNESKDNADNNKNRKAKVR